MTGKRLIPITLACLIGIAVIGYFLRRKWEAEHVYVHTRATQSAVGWGYEILLGDSVYIHQEFIPAVQGKHGFRNAEDALKVGRVVIGKMKKQEGEAVSVEELKGLGVLDSLPGVK